MPNFILILRNVESESPRGLKIEELLQHAKREGHGMSPVLARGTKKVRPSRELCTRSVQ